MAKPAPARPFVKDAFTAAFTRSQVEWALWYHVPERAKRKPTQSFKIKAKHLLEFDRSEPIKSPARSLAFSDEPPGGRGEHSLFSVFDAFMLEAALDFLSVGLKRKEVVTYLRIRRASLRKGLGTILDRRLKQATTEITTRNAVSMAQADPEGVILHAVSLDEAPETMKQLKDIPFYSTHEEVLRNINDRPHVIMLDLSLSAHHLPTFLLKAPLRRRGRS